MRTGDRSLQRAHHQHTAPRRSPQPQPLLPTERSAYTINDNTWCSGGAQDEVNTRVGRDNVAHLANLEPKGRFFEGLLHLTPPKHAEVTAFCVTTAITMNLGQLCEYDWIAPDLGLEAT